MAPRRDCDVAPPPARSACSGGSNRTQSPSINIPERIRQHPARLTADLPRVARACRRSRLAKRLRSGVAHGWSRRKKGIPLRLRDVGGIRVSRLGRRGANVHRCPKRQAGRDRVECAHRGRQDERLGAARAGERARPTGRPRLPAVALGVRRPVGAAAAGFARCAAAAARGISTDGALL